MNDELRLGHRGPSHCEFSGSFTQAFSQSCTHHFHDHAPTLGSSLSSSLLPPWLSFGSIYYRVLSASPWIPSATAPTSSSSKVSPTANVLQPVRQVFVIAALHFVGKHQYQKLRVIEFFLAGIGPAVR